MIHGNELVSKTDKIKIFRWLFYMSTAPIVCLFVFPIIVFPVPMKIKFSLEVLGALTVGVLFAFFFLGVNVYGYFVDKQRKPLYIVMLFLMSGWLLWAIISWKYIQYMDYLLR
jgi:lipopolysaccharide export LptBFGC system permease protein LptF